LIRKGLGVFHPSRNGLNPEINLQKPKKNQPFSSQNGATLPPGSPQATIRSMLKDLGRTAKKRKPPFSPKMPGASAT
jgi:hypothetical protein